VDRRIFVTCVGSSLLGVAFATNSQQPGKIPRLGFLRADPPPPGYTDAFEAGLRDRGYIVGKSILIEYRFGDGSTADVSRLADELVKSKVDLIVAGGGQATRAARNATSTIPIVMVSASDPGGVGTVASLARPAGNVTGTNTLSWDLFGKRLELLKQIVPTISRVAVLHNSRNPAPADAWEQALAAAANLGVKLQRVEVQSPSEFEEAFATIMRERAEELVVVQSTMFDTPPYPIAQLAATHKIPAVYGSRITSADGGLISYGPNNRDTYRYAATFVDKILKGARPGELPVERPTKLELVINLRTANKLSLTIPQALLLRADEVIQ
jgi:putative ABC transport system substrate-binding protein